MKRVIEAPGKRGWAWRGLLLAAAVGMGMAAAGCGDDQDPEGAQAFWDKIHAEKYASWKRAPGYESRKDSTASHGDQVDIFINQVMVDAIAAGAASWPVNALIVKDGYRDGEPILVAAMEKRENGWYWAEWDSDSTGEASYSGSPSICTDCHQTGKDFVRLFNPM